MRPCAFVIICNVERHDDDALIIYTDGSCLPNPRRGGYAYRCVAVDERGHEVILDYSFPGALGATNNEMELLACLAAA
jgi:ribonuclease HI